MIKTWDISGLLLKCYVKVQTEMLHTTYIVYNTNAFEINLKTFDCNVNVFRNIVHISLIIHVCMLWMHFKIA